MLLAVFAVACKKDGVAPTVAATGVKMARMVTVSGGRSTTTTVSYDAKGRLASYRQIDNTGVDDGLRVQRKADGLIEKIVFKRSGFPDSVYLTVTASGTQYTRLEWVNAYGFDKTIRTEFVYDNTGHIIQSTETDVFPTGLTDPTSRYEYTYAQGNLTTMKIFRTSGGTNSLFAQYDMTHDQKRNPLAFGAEWILVTTTGMAFAPNGSANNNSQITIKRPNQPERPFTLTYTYNEKGWPLTAVQKDAGGMEVASTTYTYE